MEHAATIRFYHNLNDFLRKGQKEQPVPYLFRMPASVKDAIESLGVPHVEVGKIVVNHTEKDFNYRVQPQDCIDVFPYDPHLPPTAPKTFVLDVHLGRLARLLRMLGIDALYTNHLNDKEIVDIAVAQNRAALTRDVGLLKHRALRYGYWLRSQWPEEQVAEVVQRFSLCLHLQPFSRCMACNGLLTPVSKAAVEPVLPEQTRQYFHAFYQCGHCGRVYWKGSHYHKMQRKIEEIISRTC